MRIDIMTSNPFAENTYFIVSEDNQVTVIDPGFSNELEAAAFYNRLDSEGWTVEQIVLTHGHVDHVFGCAELKEKYQIPLYMHALAQDTAARSTDVAQMFGMHCNPVPKADAYIDEQQQIQMGGVNWQILFCPGHSVGSLCFYHAPSQELIAGDVLFEGSIGRTDLPGGNYDQLIQSIKTKLLPLPDDVIVMPGHGGPTTIGQERASNPFLQD